MDIDFDNDGDTVDFSTVPGGTYRVRVAEVRPGIALISGERWALRLVVAEGPHAGKQAAWDSIVFSARGRARARMVFAALGLPSTGKVQVEPEDLEGREAMVDVRPCGEVPYDGYRRIEV